jgi:membrane protein implicated in regulation of membrane protease activity
LLIAPTSHHRIVFRLGDKEHLVRTANRLTILGLVFVALALVGAILLISDLLFPGVVAVAATSAAVLTCLASWYVLPLIRRRRVREQAARDTKSRVQTNGSF